MKHEVLVSLFHERPALAPELLCHALGRPVAAHLAARIMATDFRDLMPAAYSADAFLALEDAAGAMVEGLIVEVQLGIDADKRRSWPLYIAGAHARFGVLVTLLVVTVDPEVARWCAQPIALDQAGSVIRPLVLRPDVIPAVTDPEAARAELELALVSVAAHGRQEDEEAVQIGRAAFTAVSRLALEGRIDEARAVMYADFILASLGLAARRALESIMQIKDYEFQSEFFRNAFAEREKLGRREMLTKLLTRRFGELPAELKARMTSADVPALELWAERVLTAQSLAEVFAEPSTP